MSQSQTGDERPENNSIENNTVCLMHMIDMMR